jgi:hypothetical protein
MPPAVTRQAIRIVRSHAGRATRAVSSLRQSWVLSDLDKRLTRDGTQISGVRRIVRKAPDRWRINVAVDGVTCHFELTVRRGNARLSVVAGNQRSKRVLRSALVGRATMVQGKVERHVLDEWPITHHRGPVVEEFMDEVGDVLNLLEQIPHEARPTRPIPPGYALTYWWDLKPNFGDVIGPWLVQKLLGAPVVNSRSLEPPRPSLFTVGSVIGHLDRPGHHVWGSGVINPIGPEKRERIAGNQPEAIHAVRGRLTRQELMDKLGWAVPEVYGDPALLMPKYHRPSASAPTTGEVAVVPHYSHRPLFAQVRGTGFRVVDATDGLERVVDAIANADRCVSTSLHGVIIAQAYEVPWVWLRLEDNQLHGDTFKFEDFFTVVDRSQVAELSVAASAVPEIDYLQVSRAARLPTLTGNLQALHDAFPTDGPWRHPTS